MKRALLVLFFIVSLSVSNYAADTGKSTEKTSGRERLEAAYDKLHSGASAESNESSSSEFESTLKKAEQGEAKAQPAEDIGRQAGAGFEEAQA